MKALPVVAISAGAAVAVVLLWRRRTARAESLTQGETLTAATPQSPDAVHASPKPAATELTLSAVLTAPEVSPELPSSPIEPQKKRSPKKPKKSLKDEAPVAAAGDAAPMTEASEASRAAQAEAVRAAVLAVGRPKAPPPQPPPAAASEEPEATASDNFVNAIVNRSVLAQPSDLSVAARPSSKKSEKLDKKKDKKKAKEKPLSSWAEGFIEAMQLLDANATDSTPQAQQKLNGVLASASKPGAPKDALPLTLRALGYIFASTAHLDRALAAYQKVRGWRGRGGRGGWRGQRGWRGWRGW